MTRIRFEGLPRPALRHGQRTLSSFRSTPRNSAYHRRGAGQVNRRPAWNYRSPRKDLASRQPSAAETLKIKSALVVAQDRHVFINPREGDIGLRTAQFDQRRAGNVEPSRHACSRSQHAKGADEVVPQPDAFACEPYRLVEVVAEELGVGRDAIIDPAERVTRAQSQGTSCRLRALLPAAAVAECQP